FTFLEVPYKPFTYRNRGVPSQGIIWRPVLSIKINYDHTPSKSFDAFLDSGSDYCLFHASIGAGIGIKIVQDTQGDLGGLISNNMDARSVSYRPGFFLDARRAKCAPTP